jgi:hypothetical protein
MTTTLVLLAAVVLAIGIRWYFGGDQVPAGQSPLAQLNGDSLESLKVEFNRSANGARIILLLSPT